VSPQPTTTSSYLFFWIDCFDKFDCLPLATSALTVLRVGSSPNSRLSLSNHSARAFHTPAMSSQPSRFGLSLWLIRFHSKLVSALSRCRFDLIILMPCSLTHKTYFPDKDHLIVLMVPSPLCRTLSVPVLGPSPIDPSQPEAAAAAPVVVALALLPACPPVVRTKFPACPPDR
jgi:hypothetical protein